MAQYLRVPMPQPTASDPLRSLADVMRLAQTSQSMDLARRNQTLEEAKAARGVADTAAIDAVQSPQTAMAVQQGDPGWQGPVNPATPPTPLSREAMLAQLPGHLRPVIQKQFDDADKQGREAQTSILQLRKAQQEAMVANNDYLGELGFDVIQHKGDPTAAQFAIEHAKTTYAQFPDLQQRVTDFASKVTADPAQNMSLAKTLVSSSPKYTDKLMKLGKENVIELGITAATATLPDGTPDTDARKAAQDSLDKIAEYERAKATPRDTSLEEDFTASYARDVAKKPVSALTNSDRVAAHKAWIASGRDPEVAADRRDRQQQSTDIRLWSADRASAMQQYKTAVDLYNKDFGNLALPPGDPRRKPPPPMPDAATQSLEEWQGAHPPNKRQPVVAAPVQPAGPATLAPPTPVMTPGRATVEAPAAAKAPSASSGPVSLNIDGKHVEFESAAKRDAWLKKHNLVLK